MNFMKTFLAALLAFVVANILVWIFVMMVIASITAFMNEPVPTVKSGSVLRLDLSGGVTDSPESLPAVQVTLSGSLIFNKTNTILEVVSAIEHAAADERIEGIYIRLSGGSVSLANIEEIRNALLQFKESGKFIISYSDTFGQMGYYLASVADAVYLNPQGDIDWKGMASSVMFYKGLLDKLGVEPEILRHGSFKAAVEPFMYDRMSPENRLQMNTLLNTIWGSILHDVSLSRGIDSAVLSNYATELAVRSAEHAKEYGFVDELMYEDQVNEVLGRMANNGESLEYAVAKVMGLPVLSHDDVIYEPLGEVPADASEEPLSSDDAGQQWVEQIDPTGESEPDTLAEQQDVTVMEDAAGEDVAISDDYYDDYVVDNPEFISLRDYIASMPVFTKGYSKNKIAVVYADGDIIDGKSAEGSVGGETLAARLAEARKDKDVKAVVLRVNSPGGSALASEVIWREMELIRAEKPLIVSMGSMAASGGYYISCPADVIISDRMTLTGSIGVFGILFNASNAMRDKLGITVDVARTNPSADYGSMFRGLSANEREAIMFGVEQVYDTFVGHVADGRNMTYDAVDRIGGGRVWSGVSASEIGLVDGFGGIKHAIALAADRAGIAEDFRVWQVVESSESLTELLRSLGGVFAPRNIYGDDLGEMLVHYRSIRNMVNQQGGVQARMPFIIELQ